MTGIDACKSDVYVNEEHDKPCRNSKRPPSIRVIVDAELVKKRRWEIRP